MKVYRIYDVKGDRYLRAGADYRSFWQRKHVAHEHASKMRGEVEVHAFQLVPCDPSSESEKP